MPEKDEALSLDDCPRWPLCFGAYTDGCKLNAQGDVVTDPCEIRACLQDPIHLSVTEADRIELVDTFKVIASILTSLIVVGCACLCFSYESFWNNIKPLFRWCAGPDRHLNDEFEITYQDEGKNVTVSWAKLKKKAMQEGYKDEAWYKSLSEDKDEEEISLKAHVDMLV